MTCLKWEMCDRTLMVNAQNATIKDWISWTNRLPPERCRPEFQMYVCKFNLNASTAMGRLYHTSGGAIKEKSHLFFPAKCQFLRSFSLCHLIGISDFDFLTITVRFCRKCGAGALLLAPRSPGDEYLSSFLVFKLLPGDFGASVWTDAPPSGCLDGLVGC